MSRILDSSGMARINRATDSLNLRQLKSVLRIAGIAMAISSLIFGCKSTSEKISQTKDFSEAPENPTPQNAKIFQIAEISVPLSVDDFSSLTERQFVERLYIAIDDIPEIKLQTDSRLFNVALYHVGATNQVQVKLALTKSGFLNLSLSGNMRTFLGKSTIRKVAEHLKEWLSPYLTSSIPRLVNGRLTFEKVLDWVPLPLDSNLKTQILQARLADDRTELHSLISNLAPWHNADPVVALIWSGWLTGLLEPKDENRVWLARGVFDLDKKNQRSFAGQALLQKVDHFQPKLMLEKDFNSLSNAFGMHSGSSQHSLALSATSDPRLANFFGHAAVLNPDIKSTFVHGEGIKRELEVFLVFAILPKDILTLGSDEYNEAMASAGPISRSHWPNRLGPPRDASAFDIDLLAGPEFQLEWRKLLIRYYWTLINDHVVDNKVIKP